jgi:hypothetical protein
MWKQREEAEEAVKNNKLILWELDFGLSDIRLETTQSSQFYNFGIAIEEFVDHIWKQFKDQTLGLILFRGDAQFKERFAWNEDHRCHFFETIHDSDLQQSLQSIIDSSTLPWHEALVDQVSFQFFAATMFAEYVQRLASYLPDEILVFSLFDVSTLSSPAHIAQLFSKDRFGHVLLALKMAPMAIGHLNWQEGACLGGWIGIGAAYFSTISEVKIGVCLPKDDHFTQEIEHTLNTVFLDLSLRQIPCRVIPEAQLTEAWDGIDYILAVSSSVSYQGKRRLQGFCAAGGYVVPLGESMGLAHEMSYSDFRGELASHEALI